MLQRVLLKIEPIHWPLLSPVAASLPLFQTVGSIQHSIWKSHWSSVFDNLPFTSPLVSNICSKNVRNIHHQNSCD
ncbi:hypothetical protein BDB01DRAFT_585626 [Pilobolus umbonatus]|nr:hypothetical protein BDB01DRAFT_585626 [Pilobolus umbonatus]